MSKEKFIIYTDGGSRGNPGPAAFGYVIEDGRNRVIKEHGEVLGETTNNIAEYSGLVAALRKLKALIGGTRAREADVDARSDSELLIRQLNGEYKIKEETLIPLFIEIWNLRQDFKSVLFTHIPREQNRQADHLVNVALDGKGGQGSLMD